jgi:hypothetical protein
MKRKSNIVMGVTAGVVLAALLSLAAIIVFAVEGAEPFRRLRTSLPIVIAVYILGGIVGGALFGLLLPLTKWRLGALGVGIAVACPVYLGASLVIQDGDIVSGLIAAICVGAIIGYGLWRPAPE